MWWKVGRCQDVQLSELFYIKECDQAVMNFLVATEVGKFLHKWMTVWYYVGVKANSGMRGGGSGIYIRSVLLLLSCAFLFFFSILFYLSILNFHFHLSVGMQGCGGAEGCHWASSPRAGGGIRSCHARIRVHTVWIYNKQQQYWMWRYTMLKSRKCKDASHANNEESPVGLPAHQRMPHQSQIDSQKRSVSKNPKLRVRFGSWFGTRREFQFRFNTFPKLEPNWTPWVWAGFNFTFIAPVMSLCSVWIVTNYICRLCSVWCSLISHSPLCNPISLHLIVVE